MRQSSLLTCADRLVMVLSAGEELLDLFSHVPATELDMALLKDNPTVGDVALLATVVSSHCKPTTL